MTAKITLISMLQKITFQVHASLFIKRRINVKPDYPKKIRCTEMTFCCYDSRSDKFIFKIKWLNKRTLEDTGDGTMFSEFSVLEEALILKSISRGFKSTKHLVGTHEKNKKDSVFSNRKEKYLKLMFILK